MKLGVRLTWLRKHAGAVIAVLVLVTILLLLTFYWLWPSWQTIPTVPLAEDQVSLRTELVKTIAQIALGGLVLVTLYFTWRRVRAAEQTVEVAQEGQITERFTKAVEQLGNQDSMVPRLGGIYALERIAKDSSKDHRQVMEVLTAYVRERKWIGEQPDSEYSYPQIPTDVQAILTVLKRRNTEYEEAEHKLDLSRANLIGADLTKICLRGANLYETDLRGARLIDADLQETNLIHTDLSSANLSGTNLQKAYIGEASADPEMPYDSDFHRAILKDADLQGACLQLVSFWGTNLKRANLAGGNFQYSHFVDAKLQNANLTGSDFRWADFRNADLKGADLTQADFRMAMHLTQEQVDSAITDGATKLPNNLRSDQSQ